MSVTIIIWLAAVFVGAVLLLNAGAVLTPFIIALIIAYIGSPLVEKLAAGPLGRIGSTLLVLVGLILIIVVFPLLLLPLLFGQLISLASDLPELLTSAWAWLGANVPPLAFMADMNMRDLFADWELSSAQLSGAKATGAMVAKTLADIGIAAGFVVTTLLLTPLVAFYLLRDFPSLVKRTGNAIPTQLRPTISHIATIFDQTLSEFLRGQFSVMLLMAVIYSGLLLIAGIPFAFAIGVVTGLLCFIPFAGFALGFLIAIAVTLLNLESWLDLVWVTLAMGVGSVIEGFFLTPKIVGEKSGLGPVALILAVSVMGSLFGFVGMLVAVPIAAVVLAVLRHYLAEDSTLPTST